MTYTPKKAEKDLNLFYKITEFIVNRQGLKSTTTQTDIMRQFNISQDIVAKIIKEIKLKYAPIFMEYPSKKDYRKKIYKFSFAPRHLRTPDGEFDKTITIEQALARLDKIHIKPIFSENLIADLTELLTDDIINFLNSSRPHKEKMSILYEFERYLPSFQILRDLYQKEHMSSLSNRSKASQQEENDVVKI